MKQEIDVELYKERILEEFDLITRKDFTRYFLIIADLIQWAKDNDIMIGPGRGSVTGSIIAYLLGITDIDSIKFKTSFARFLNEARSFANPPDVDTDAPDIKRELLISRLKTLYGENNVAGISTFGQIKDKQALKDVAKAFDVPFQEANNFSKTIESDLESALGTEEGRRFQEKYPDVIRHALKLRNNCKSVGQHPSGQIISNEDLTLGTRSNLAERKGHIVIGADMEDVDYMGLLKLDLLGLSTLSCLEHSMKLVKENHGIDIDLNKIELDNKEIFKSLSKGDNTAIPQFNTFAMSGLCKDMQINSFSDMVAALACVRPGPRNSGITDRFIRNKKTGNWQKKHPVYEEIVKETYGELIFQEQILEVFIKIAGLSPEVAEKIRKIIGKKRDQKYFLEHKDTFITGAKKVGYFTEEEAENFWNSLLNFAEYAFSKNHSVAYSKIAYDCAFMKQNYPSEFIAATLTYGNESKENLLKEATRLGLQVVPPKISTSDTHNWIVSEKRLYIPFKEVKGIGEKALTTIKTYQDALKQTGGFIQKELPVIKGKLKQILEDIGAFTPDGVPETIDSFFSLGVPLNPKVKFRKLFELVPDASSYNINQLLTGNIKGRHFGAEILDKQLPIRNLISCSECELRLGCDKPAITKVGNYNVLVIDEQPGYFTEKNHAYLFKELKRYGFEPDDFCVTHLCKCSGRKATGKEFKTCGDKWLKKEISQTNSFISLTIGNGNVKYIKGDDAGIMRANGTCEWSEELGIWIVYSVGPSMAQWKDEFRKPFRDSIKMFVSKLEDLGGFV